MLVRSFFLKNGNFLCFLAENGGKHELPEHLPLLTLYFEVIQCERARRPHQADLQNPFPCP